MSKIPKYLVDLHRSLDGRLRPEDVLAIIVRGAPGAVPSSMRPNIRPAGSKAGPRWDAIDPSWSSMSTDFVRPVGAAAQFASAARAFNHPLQPVSAHGLDPDSPSDVAFAVSMLAEEIGGNGPRLTREQRAAAGLGNLSRRKYNRQWRAMRRLHHKGRVLSVEQKKRGMQIIGHSGFGADITLERFAADRHAAHFIAYWVARKNLRRQFTLSGRQNPMDTVAAWFLRACVDATDTDWAMVAWVCPNVGILKRLTGQEVGELLGKWFNVMLECSHILMDAWPSDVDKWTMVVRRGHDSSTWNTMATAYNMARSSWLACIAALGAERLLDARCPGKVMRLMAADLMRWHSSVGDDVEPNTKVWAWLPMPWEVLHGTQPCSRAAVERACTAAGLDPRSSGWTAPRPAGEPAPFTVTPELVHGVTVASPEWAALLRRAGVFSGKGVTVDTTLMADALHGLQQGVVQSELPVKRPVE